MTFRQLIAFSVALAVFLPGCTTKDAYTGEEKTSSASKGAAIGAGVGALLGYLTSKDKDRRSRNKAILMGAGIGGLGGGAVGGYMDKQEKKLRKQLEGTGVSVTRRGNELILNMPGNITFATDSSTLRQSFYAVLDSVVLVLNEFEQTLIEVAGHTDSIGASAYNQNLSEKRALSVGYYLREKGIKSKRVDTLGFGEERPIADNNTPKGRQQNRRVELTLIPIEAEG